MQGVQGPTGPRGPTGIQGATGPQGNPGPLGVNGALGITGIQGVQGIRGYPGPSPTPVRIQVLTSAAFPIVTTVGPNTVDILAYATNYPTLSSGSSTSIDGMSVTTKEIILQPGMYYIEAVATFPKGDSGGGGGET